MSRRDLLWPVRRDKVKALARFYLVPSTVLVATPVDATGSGDGGSAGTAPAEGVVAAVGGFAGSGSVGTTAVAWRRRWGAVGLGHLPRWRQWRRRRRQRRPPKSADGGASVRAAVGAAAAVSIVEEPGAPGLLLGGGGASGQAGRPGWRCRRCCRCRRRWLRRRLLAGVFLPPGLRRRSRPWLAIRGTGGDPVHCFFSLSTPSCLSSAAARGVHHVYGTGSGGTAGDSTAGAACCRFPGVGGGGFARQCPYRTTLAGQARICCARHVGWPPPHGRRERG